MNKIGLLLILITSSLPGFADVPYNSWWQKGNSFYAAGEYDSAAHYYEQLAKLQPENEAVYYNLGNSYYRLNQIGPAVLNYERALEIEPGYDAARDNLALTQSRISNRIPSLPDIFFVQWWKSLTRSGMSEVWAVVGLILFLASLALLFMRRWNLGPRLPMQLFAVSLILCVCSVFMAFISANRRVSHNRAVVMQQDAPMKETPQSINTLSLIPEGTIVNIGADRSDWLQVKLPDGRNGWMHHTLLEKI
jgi:hypothetical protein